MPACAKPELLPADPLVSVAMITYNHENYISQAIQGVLNQQTAFPYELVVGEDCSLDNTRQIVLDFQQRFPHRVRAITSPRNVGGHQNAHRVVQACRGKFIAFCEGDDYWHNPQKLQVQVDFLEANPDYGLVHGDVRIHSVTTGVIENGTSGRSERWRDDNAYLEILSGSRIIWTPTACLRANLYRALLQRNPECRDEQFLMGDVQTWLEISRLAKVKGIPEQLATRNELPESASRSRDPRKMLRFALSAKAILEHYLQKYECPLDLATAVRLRHTRCVLYYAFKALDREEAQRQYTALKAIPQGISARYLLFCLGSRSGLLQKAIGLIIKGADGIGRLRRSRPAGGSGTAP
jgi:glycosyltransferase involved in cell wall biosynthesis